MIILILQLNVQASLCRTICLILQGCFHIHWQYKCRSLKVWFEEETRGITKRWEASLVAWVQTNLHTPDDWFAKHQGHHKNGLELRQSQPYRLISGKKNFYNEARVIAEPIFKVVILFCYLQKEYQICIKLCISTCVEGNFKVGNYLNSNLKGKVHL